MERVSGAMAGMNLQAPPSLAELRHLAPVLHRLTQSHGGEGLRVFGSVARGVAEADSDLDLLVDFPGSPSFEQFMDLKLALEDLLNVRVDLVTRKGLRAELRDRIEQEALPPPCLSRAAHATGACFSWTCSSVAPR
jgi:predicted nucleotidyltransferase